MWTDRGVADGMESDAHRPSRRSIFLVAAVTIALTFLGVGLVSRYALLTVVLEGPVAVVVMVPAALFGLWLLRLFRLEPMPLRWHLLLGTTLGLGAASTLVLLLGLGGLLQRSLWMVILSAFTIAGLLRLRTVRIEGAAWATNHATEPSNGGSADRCLWLLACPFMILALLAASTAPGFIWQEEGYGYDVLEYHLQLPKEYHDAGRIEYLPHNVYANFPANVEMLYLLGMIVRGDALDAGVTANLIHWMFALLTVFAAWGVAREWSSHAGVVCGVVVVTCGWIVYLSGLAYVENGMLFYGLVATGWLLRSIKPRGGRDDAAAGAGRRDLSLRLRHVALAGVVAGFACGCKYTAIPMIAAPLGVALLLGKRQAMRDGFLSAGVFTVATLVTVSPWLIKNQVMTGNPVFPLANGLFEASPPGWDAEATQSWNRGHAIPFGQRTLTTRLHALWNHVLWDRHHRFGPVMIALALVGLFGRRRDRTDAVLLVILVIQLGVWLFATHLFARFAVVVLIPLALLCGRAVLGRHAWRPVAVAVVVVVGAVWDFTFTYRLARAELPGDAPASLIYEGTIPGYEYFATVNQDLSPSDRLLLVGDAKAFYFNRPVDYCVVFNRNPFLEAVRDAVTEQDVLNWLRDEGYTHVMVHWPEMWRLASTYGFTPRVDPARLMDLFDRLSARGLLQRRSFSHPAVTGRYVDLFAIKG